MEADNESLFSKRLGHFATLATRLDFLGVAPFSLGCHTSHTCHSEKQIESENSASFKTIERNALIGKWLHVVLEEGHIEPSQPTVGRIVGWPCRPFLKNSLWVEFCCWCKQQKQYRFPVKDQFYDVLDRVFEVKGDMYCFPALEDCRIKFETIRRSL